RLRRRRPARARGAGRRRAPPRHAQLSRGRRGPRRGRRWDGDAGVSAPAWGATWPDLPTFRELAADRRVIPVVRRLLADDVTPVGLYRQLAAGRPGTFILESAEHGAWARWSFVGVRSRATLLARDG